jgi:hypothetical protein
VFLIPFVLLNLSIIFSCEYKNKFIVFLFVFWIFLMQNYR